jgi:hypothetical protein
MDLEGKKEIYTEEHILNTIKNISKQLNLIKNFYKKNDFQEKFENHEKINEIQGSIEELMSNIEENNNNEVSSVCKLISDVKDNDTLIISEKTNKVFLPYTVLELEEYYKEYPNEYNSLTDVINQEYIVSLDKYKNQTISRFRETYCLMRDIEMKSKIEAFKIAVSVMFNSKLNPAIISGCKSEEQFKKYIYCAEHNNMDEFKEFKIVFDMSPFNICNSNDLEYNYTPKSKKKRKGKHSQ